MSPCWTPGNCFLCGEEFTGYWYGHGPIGTELCDDDLHVYGHEQYALGFEAGRQWADSAWRSKQPRVTW